jgi:hypothetical protein
MRDGAMVTPRAMIHFCETCGFEGAAFGIHRGDRLLSYCGWVNGRPVCVGKGRVIEPSGTSGELADDLFGRVA